MLSPVWESKLCRFSSGPKKILSLEGEEKETFNSVISLACGKDVTVSGLAALLDLGRLAEKYFISDVSNAVQLEAIRVLNTTNCAELLIASEATGLSALSKASRDLALEQFSQVAETDGFLHLDKTTLAALLEDEGLMGREEPVYQGVLRWILRGNTHGGKPRGMGLISKVRLTLLDHDSVRGVLEGLEGLDERTQSDLLRETIWQRAVQARGAEGGTSADHRPSREIRWGRVAQSTTGLGIQIRAYATCRSIVATKDLVFTGLCNGKVEVSAWPTLPLPTGSY